MSSTDWLLGGLAIAVVGGAVYAATKKDEPEEITTDELADTHEAAAEQAIDNMTRDDEIVARSPGINPLSQESAAQIVNQQTWQAVTDAIAMADGDPCEAARRLEVKKKFLAETEPGSPLYWETEALYWLVQSRCDAKAVTGRRSHTGRRPRTGACCASCAKGHECEASCLG